MRSAKWGVTCWGSRADQGCVGSARSTDGGAEAPQRLASSAAREGSCHPVIAHTESDGAADKLRPGGAEGVAVGVDEDRGYATVPLRRYQKNKTSASFTQTTNETAGISMQHPQTRERALSSRHKRSRGSSPATEESKRWNEKRAVNVIAQRRWLHYLRLLWMHLANGALNVSQRVFRLHRVTLREQESQTTVEHG